MRPLKKVERLWSAFGAWTAPDLDCECEKVARTMQRVATIARCLFIISRRAAKSFDRPRFIMAGSSINTSQTGSNGALLSNRGDVGTPGRIADSGYWKGIPWLRMISSIASWDLGWIDARRGRVAIQPNEIYLLAGRRFAPPSGFFGERIGDGEGTRNEVESG